ncbi:ParB N-terminal domain-containing protein [Streptomyces sp. NPDC059788]|uniref:ParB N-terminal domain-containing protein n=1 Tax=Streptomyces sp. NPDC059788 TaxID=3346948 RepID=UPI003648454C
MISAILPGESPRFVQQDEAHIRRLAETDSELPPILVHRRTMRVIDGSHRLRAALLQQRKYIDVEFFDGTEAEAYVVGIQANTAHGLPLSLAERKAAAGRVIQLQPEQSDRVIARITGLSAKTVGALRGRSSEENPQPNTRLGRDGRVRPLSFEEGRRRALAVIKERPGATVREIAREAGVSVGTAHSLRVQVERGRPAEPSGSTDTGCRIDACADHVSPDEAEAKKTPPPRNVARVAYPLDNRRAPDVTSRISGPVGEPGGAGQQPRPPGTARGSGAAYGGPVYVRMERLQRDPSLRFSERGRSMLIWLRRCLVTANEAELELGDLPQHLLPTVAGLAKECADEWQRLAVELNSRTRQLDFQDLK